MEAKRKRKQVEKKNVIVLMHIKFVKTFFPFFLFPLRRRAETGDVLPIQIARGIASCWLLVRYTPRWEIIGELNGSTSAHLVSSFLSKTGIIRGAGDAALACSPLSCFYVCRPREKRRRVGGGNGRNFPLRSLAGSFHTYPSGSASIVLVAAAFSFFLLLLLLLLLLRCQPRLNSGPI